MDTLCTEEDEVSPFPSKNDYRILYEEQDNATISMLMTMAAPYTYIMKKLFVDERITVIAIEKEIETDITSDLAFKIALAKFPECAIAIDVVYAQDFGDEDLSAGEAIIRRIEDSKTFNRKPNLETLQHFKFVKKIKSRRSDQVVPLKQHSFFTDKLDVLECETKRKPPKPLYLIERAMSINEKEQFDRKLIELYVNTCVDLKRRPIEFHGGRGPQSFGEIVNNFSSLVKRAHCNSCFARMNLAMFYLDDALNCGGCYADEASISNKPYIIPRGGGSTRYIMSDRPGYLSPFNSHSVRKKHCNNNDPVIPSHIKEAMRKSKKSLELSKKNQSRYTMGSPKIFQTTSFGEPLVEDLFAKSQIDIPPVEHLVLSSASDLYGEPLMPESRSWVTTDVSKFDSSDSSDSFTNYKENVGVNDSIQYHPKRQFGNVKKEPLYDSSNDYAKNSVNCFQVPQSGPIPFIVEEALIDSSAEAFKFLRVDPGPIPTPHFLKWEKLPQLYTVRNKNAEPCGRMTASTLGDPRYTENSETVDGKTRGTIYFAISYEIDSCYVYESSHLGRTDIPADIMKNEKKQEKEEVPPSCNRKRELPYSPELEVRRLRLSTPSKEETVPNELPISLKFGKEQTKKKKFSLKSKNFKLNSKNFILKPFHGMFNLKK